MILRSLRYYWRTNLAVIAGVATAVAVLTGALLVGGSVRESLRDLVLRRLGGVNFAATGSHFFHEQLAQETGGCPLIVIDAVVTNAGTRRRASGVSVYGVDERFWSFQKTQVGGDVLVSPGLADEVGVGELLLRVDKPSAIPKESLHGRKDEGKTIRVKGAAILDAAHGGEFSLRPQQGAVKAIFVPLRRLQRELSQPGHVNTILYGGDRKPELIGKVTLDDLGIRTRELPGGEQSIESDSAIVGDSLAGAVGSGAHPVFSYLANTIRVGSREISYSLITAVDSSVLPIDDSAIDLNEWTAHELNAKPGDTVGLDYYVWGDGGSLLTRSASFKLRAVIPITGIAADRNLTPEYPGITAAKTLRDWDPPFPMDLARIRPRDEAYWEQYRTTPKAFISIAAGQRLWSSRFGRMTSLRLDASHQLTSATLLSRLDPAKFGLSVYSPRTMGLEGARGSTDFGEYFTYFSFFLMASALLLVGLFFRLGVDQRLREIGTLLATGWPLARIWRSFLLEGVILASIGSAIGGAGAIGYCAFVLYGLSTWWRGAVGTSLLRLHVDTASVATGILSGLVIAAVVIWLALRGLRRTSARSLLSGVGSITAVQVGRGWVRMIAWILAAAALSLIVLGVLKRVSASEAFFGAGTSLLVSAVMLISQWLRSSNHRGLSLDRSPTLWSFGFRNASYRPGRSILCIALIASAVFLIVALDAFRLSGSDEVSTGGFALMAESQLPILWDPNTPAGRESLNLAPVMEKLNGVRFSAFRLRPGEDASCLNLYEPRTPRVLGARPSFISKGRFRFAESLAATPELKANPWLLLDGVAGGATPAIADANSISYVLHKKLGDEVEVNGHRLKLVAALDDSALQSELIVSEGNFIRLFPEEQGYRFFLIDVPSSGAGAGAVLEDALSDYGFDARPVAAQVAGYHQVENAYLSTFQALGALGLLLGTIGLAAVLLRNVLERRRELAVLSALGYARGQLTTLVMAENAFLVLCGLVAGSVCAALAVSPAVVQRGGGLPIAALLLLLVGVPVTAWLSSWAAVRVVRRSPLLASLRSE